MAAVIAGKEMKKPATYFDRLPDDSRVSFDALPIGEKQVPAAEAQADHDHEGHQRLEAELKPAAAVWSGHRVILSVVVVEGQSVIGLDRPGRVVEVVQPDWLAQCGQGRWTNGRAAGRSVGGMGWPQPVVYFHFYDALVVWPHGEAIPILDPLAVGRYDGGGGWGWLVGRQAVLATGFDRTFLGLLRAGIRRRSEPRFKGIFEGFWDRYPGLNGVRFVGILRGQFPTVGHAVLDILTAHTAMHVGQITVWRRAMGLAAVQEDLPSDREQCSQAAGRPI